MIGADLDQISSLQSTVVVSMQLHTEFHTEFHTAASEFAIWESDIDTPVATVPTLIRPDRA